MDQCWMTTLVPIDQLPSVSFALGSGPSRAGQLLAAAAGVGCPLSVLRGVDWARTLCSRVKSCFSRVKVGEE